MRIVYYSRPNYIDSFLPRAVALSKIMEVHVLEEIAPETWNGEMRNLPSALLQNTIVTDAAAVDMCFPGEVRRSLRGCASFGLVLHTQKRSLHPSSWVVSREAIRYIRNLKPDILHIEDIQMRLAPALLGINDIPVVLDVHDVIPHTGERNWRQSLSRWLTFRRASHFVFYSRFSMNQFRQRYPAIPESKLSSISFGPCDLLARGRTRPVPTGDRRVLLLGRMSPYKGVEYFLAAARTVSREIDNCVFTIAGKTIAGYDLPGLPHLDGNCRFEVINERIPDQRMADLFDAATVVVCPYTDATQSGIIPIAYAFDKPVIATDVGGLSEYVWEGRTGIIVPPRDAHALAAGIVSVLCDRAFREQVAGSIRQFTASALSWENSAAKLLSVYQSLTAEGRPAQG